MKAVPGAEHPNVKFSYEEPRVEGVGHVKGVEEAFDVGPVRTLQQERNAVSPEVSIGNLLEESAINLLKNILLFGLLAGDVESHRPLLEDAW